MLTNWRLAKNIISLTLIYILLYSNVIGLIIHTLLNLTFRYANKHTYNNLRPAYNASAFLNTIYI